MSFKANEDKVMELFNRKVYNVPRNQRRYVWNKDNWQELFDDVMAVVNGVSKSHFIGSIVLKSDSIDRGLPHFSVIDGQQRIITLSIFLASIMFWMKKLEMNDDFNGTLPYVMVKDDKNKDIVAVSAENNASLDAIIKAIIYLQDNDVKKTTVNSIVESNLLNRSDKNVGDAFRFFMNKISDYYIENDKDTQLLIKLRDALRNITFVNITATTEEDSYTIFEILNARGMDLEDHELLKNYIMRYIQPEENRDRAKTEWVQIEDTLGRSNLKKFVRHYTTHLYGDYVIKTETSAYKIIRDRNKGKETWKLLRDLECKANYYLKLVEPCKSGDNSNCSDVEYRVYSFFKKKRQEQLRPVLLSLITRNKNGTLSNELYENTLEFLYNFYVCYNIIGEENSNKLTDTVKQYAAKINRDETEKSLIRFVDELRNKLPSENLFINSFKTIGWSHGNSIYSGEKNKTRVQTVLEILERYHNNGNCMEDFTIEHVLPDSADSSNGQIGNLIPLEKNLNQRCEDKDYDEKLTVYSDSSYATARRFAKRYFTDTFTPEKRTEYMAKEFYNEILKLKEHFDGI